MMTTTGFHSDDDLDVVGRRQAYRRHRNSNADMNCLTTTICSVLNPRKHNKFVYTDPLPDSRLFFSS